MQTFEYMGRNQRGEVQRGTIEAANSQAVASWLLASGIYPIKVVLQKSGGMQRPAWFDKLGGGEITLRDRLLFTRQMGNMVRAGVPMLDALAGIQKSNVNPRLAEVIQNMRNDLEKGMGLSMAFARHPKLFDDYYVNMIKVGESTGRLEESFQRLFSHLDFQEKMRKKIKSALRYPTFVIIAIMIAIAVVTLFVIPTFAKMYAGFRAELPLVTRMLMGASNFALHYWWLVMLMVAGMVFAFKRYVATERGRYFWDRNKLRLPAIGKITKMATLARFCSSLSTASRSGVPLVQAFTLVSQVVDNAFYEARILQMRSGIERGESILRVAQSADIFTPMELQMISVGEATGDIDNMLGQVAEIYEEEVDFEVSRLSETIEPILLAFMGGLVLILMLGVFLPIWRLGAAAAGHV